MLQLTRRRAERADCRRVSVNPSSCRGADHAHGDWLRALSPWLVTDPARQSLAHSRTCPGAERGICVAANARAACSRWYIDVQFSYRLVIARPARGPSPGRPYVDADDRTVSAPVGLSSCADWPSAPCRLSSACWYTPGPCWTSLF
jgi:hypothetical protein